MIKFCGYDKVKIGQKGAVPLLILLAVIGVIGVFAVSSIAPFRDQLLSELFPKQASDAASPADWPQAGHDAQRTNASSQTVIGPYRWYWRWNSVPTAARAQPVVVNNIYYQGSLNGNLYALDAVYDSRGLDPKILWQKDLGSPIRSSAAVDGSVVIVGTQNGSLYGLNALTGNQIWSVTVDGAIVGAPVVSNGNTYVGSGGGYFYSIRNSDGAINWQKNLGFPIVGGAAVSEDSSRVFFAAENLKAYALSTADGSQFWAAQLNGQSVQDRWPVISGDRVVFSVQPYWDQWQLLNEGDTAMDAAGAKLTDWVQDWNIVKPQIISYLNANPTKQTTYVLDTGSGSVVGPAPILHSYGDQDAAAMPAVYNGNFYTRYRARHGIQTDSTTAAHVSSKYDSEFGMMNPQTLDITGISSPNVFSYQWRATSDESGDPSFAGNMLLIDSWERLGGISLSSTNSGNLVFIAQLVGGSCAWGGGAINLPYYDSCPTSGGIGNQVQNGEGGARPGAVVASGRIFWHGGAIGPSAGTTSLVQPLSSPAASMGPVPSSVPVSNQTLTSIIYAEPVRPVANPSSDLVQKLEAEVTKIVTANKHLLPIFLPRGITGTGSFPPDTTNPPEPTVVGANKLFWYDQGEMVLALSQTLPYLNPTLQSQLKTYLKNEISRYSPLSNLPYGGNWDWMLNGQAREFYPLPGRSSLVNNSWPPPAVPIQTIYSLWAYAKYSGDWTYIQNNYTSIKSLYNNKKNSINSYGRIAGAIGMARIAKQLGNTADQTDAENTAITAMQSGTNFNTFLTTADTLFPNAFESGDAPNAVPGRRGGVFFGLTPEVGNYLRVTNGAAVDWEISNLANYPHGAYMWYVTRLGLQSERSESSYHSPEIAWSLFLAQAYIKQSNQSQLRRWLDRPVGIGDPYHLSKLVATLEASGSVNPSPSVIPSILPSPSTTPSASPSPSALKPGDIDGNNKVDIFDYNLLLTNFGQSGTGIAGDINGNGKVDIFDYNILLTNFGK